MHQLVRRQAKTQPGALHCSICEPGCVRICVLKKKKKKKEFLNLSITHLLILSFQSLISAPFFFAVRPFFPLLLSSSGPAAAQLKVIFFFLYLCLNSPHRIWPFAYLSSAAFFWSYPHCLAVWSLCPLCLLYGSFGLARSGTAGSGFTLCSGSVGGVGCYWGRGGGRGCLGEMERIMEGSLHTGLLQRKLLNPLSGSLQDLLLHLKWQLLLWLD